MNIRSIDRGKTVTEVMVENIGAVSEDMIVGFAMAAVNEDPHSLFGWSVDRYKPPFHQTVTVRLHKD